VLWVVGELDLLTSPQLANRLTGELAHQPTCLIIDLTGVSHLGSTGLQVLVEARAAARTSNCRLQLAGTTAAVVRQPLELTGLLSLFTCHDTVDQALSELA
jgi:anti-anti-sigma factor